jgi:glucose-6-phosphate isomerase
MNPIDSWKLYSQNLCQAPSIGLTLDISRMRIPNGFLDDMRERMAHAYDAMEELEKGAIANPDEDRMVGHYWLRSPKLAPEPDLASAIRKALDQVESFAAQVHCGELKPPAAQRFTQVLLIGIGGSILGPMFAADALGRPNEDRMRMHFIDNTDPDGIARTLSVLKDRLNETLCVVTSKSGGTPETRNGAVLVADGTPR